MVATSRIKQKTKTSGDFSAGSGESTYEKIKHFGDAKHLSFYANNQKRLGFTATKDPAEVAFDHLDKQPISKLASLYFKEKVRNPMKKMFTTIR